MAHRHLGDALGHVEEVSYRLPSFALRWVASLARTRLPPACGVFVLTLLGIVADQVAQARTWKDASGKFTIEAEFVSLEDGQVHLQKPDGSVIAVPLERLSEADQQHARSLAAPIDAAQQANSKSKTDDEPAADSGVASAANHSVEDFRKAQRAILPQLRARKPESRLAAIRQLAAYPVVDAAKLLVQDGFASPDDTQRRAAYEVLLTFRNEAGICRYLLTTLETDLRKGKPGPAQFGVLGVLLATELPKIEEDTIAFLEKTAAGNEGLVLLILLADELGVQGGELSLRSLQKLIRLPAFERAFGFRRAVVQNLMRLRKPEAVGAVVSLLPNARGEVRADIVKYLTLVSGQRLGLETEPWRKWWQTVQAAYKIPDAAPEASSVEPPPAAPGTPSYYGLPLYGMRIVFVMDTSNSMRGARIEAAKRELIRAINGLPAGVEFNVLAFNASVRAWQSRLVPPTPENVQAATRFVAAQELAFATASYDALEAALAADVEAIYFLTDGAPYGGKIADPAEIVAVLSKINRLRRVTINAIGIGVGRPGNAFDTFLRSLAAQNFGVYQRVDN